MVKKGKSKAVMKKSSPSGLVRKTINELVLDLCSLDGVKAKAVESASRGMTESDLVAAFKDTESALCKSIPIRELKTTDNGRMYLDVLAIIQPKFLEEPIPIVKPTLDLSGIIEVTDENRPLIDLANDIFKNMNMPEDPKDLDIMSMIMEVSKQIEEKVGAGEIDMATLEGQASTMLESIKNKPEFSSVMENPEMMSFVMKNMGT